MRAAEAPADSALVSVAMPDERILHVDMDAFYASVEVLKDPSLRGRPVIVGGTEGRGVVTSASYEARAFGVTSAMPIVSARRLCPGGVFLPNDFPAYGRLSEQILSVFRSFTPVVEPLSLDEAFLDVSGARRLLGPPVVIAGELKRRIADIGLTCSVGVAPNKFLAKLASVAAKPDGLRVVCPGDVRSFLHPLPVTALWGVGERTGEALRRLGLFTVGDVERMPASALERALGPALGGLLYRLARGLDDNPVKPYEAPKSVGSEMTFDVDLDADTAILRALLRLSDRTAARLRSKAMCGRTVTLKVRFSNFKTITRSRTLAEETDTASDLYDSLRTLYGRLRLDRPRIRLLGVAVSALAPGPPRRQLELFSGRRAGWPEATRAMDQVRLRFGDDALGPAALLDDSPPRDGLGRTAAQTRDGLGRTAGETRRDNVSR
jgi:DNA polymerase IV